METVLWTLTAAVLLTAAAYTQFRIARHTDSLV